MAKGSMPKGFYDDINRPHSEALVTIGDDVTCGAGENAYRVVVQYPMANKALRDALKNPDHPALKGKQGEERVAAMVAEVLKQSNVVIVSRLNKDGVLSDGPKGEPAHQIISNSQVALEEHMHDGKLNDSVNGEAAFQVYEKGLLKRAVNYTNNVITMIKQFTYIDAIFKEVDNTPLARQTRIFNKAAAASPGKEWKQCNVSVEYRNADHLTIDGPRHTPGLQQWTLGYELVAGLPAELKFSNQAELTLARHYNKGQMGEDATELEKRRLPRKQWPAI